MVQTWVTLSTDQSQRNLLTLISDLPRSAARSQISVSLERTVGAGRRVSESILDNCQAVMRYCQKEVFSAGAGLTASTTSHRSSPSLATAAAGICIIPRC